MNEPQRAEGNSTDGAGRLLWRLWAPGFALAVLVGLIGLALIRQSQFFGYSLMLGVPLLAGIAIGVSVRLPAALKISLVLVLLIALVVTAMTGAVAGLLCALIAIPILLAPLVIGTLLGHWYRRQIDRFRNSRPRLGAALLILVNPVTLMAVEQHFPILYEEQRVVTESQIQAPVADVWEALVFYEDVPLEPPLLAKIGLPYPIRTDGIPQGAGDVTVCRYSSGRLVKRVSRFEAGRLLEFDVIEQQGVEDRSVRLTRGSFRLVPTAAGTRIILTTEYVPLLEARLLWRPFERSLARALHEHVLNGIELNLERRSGSEAAGDDPVD